MELPDSKTSTDLPDSDDVARYEDMESCPPSPRQKHVSNPASQKEVLSLDGLDSFTQISVISVGSTGTDGDRGGAIASFVRASDRTQILRDVLGRTVRRRTSSNGSTCSPTSMIALGRSAQASLASEGSSGRNDLSALGCAGAVINLILGNAVFTLPYGFVLGGWMSAPVVVFAIGIFLWTSMLLGYTLDELRARGVSEPDYGVVGEFAFGAKFRPFFTLLCSSECFFMCVFLLVFIAESLTAPLRLSKEVLIVIAAGFGVLLSLIPKRFVAIVSIIGLALTLTCASAVVAWGFHSQPRQHSNSLYGMQGTVGLVYTASFVGICVADHPIFPALYNSTGNSSAFSTGLVLGFMFFVAVALVVSSCTYFTFGSNVQPVVLLNMGRDSNLNPVASFTWMETVANMVIAFRTLLVLPSFIRPVVGIIQDINQHFFGTDWDLHVQKRRGIRVMLILLAFALCAITACTVQDFLPEIEALTGSLFKSVNALIIPCWSYYRLCQPKSAIIRFTIISVIIGAAVWGSYGTFSAVASIQNSVE